MPVSYTHLSIRSLANKTYVSTTVIIKLAKKLGFIGYSQMIYVLNENIHQKVSHEHTYLLSEFVNDQDVTTLMKLLDDLYKYRKQKIYLVGIGSVAYTHLDVYKRQVLDLKLLMNLLRF